MGGAGPFVGTCPSCGAFVTGPPPCPICGHFPGRVAARTPAPGPVPFVLTVKLATAHEVRLAKRWRRTRLGLVLTAIGLLLSWIPFVAAFAAFFLSFGSTFLFLGARAAGRKHEVRVVLAFLLLAVGGVVIGVLLGAFLLQAYEAARARLALSTLRDVAGLLVWGTLPATFAVAAGFGSQVVSLLPRRQVLTLIGLCGLLAATASLATWFSNPEVATLGTTPVRTGTVVDFLLRLSLYRLVEAPAYVGLAILYFLAYWDTGLRAPGPATPIAAPANPGKG